MKSTDNVPFDFFWLRIYFNILNEYLGRQENPCGGTESYVANSIDKI